MSDGNAASHKFNPASRALRTQALSTIAMAAVKSMGRMTVGTISPTAPQVSSAQCDPVTIALVTNGKARIVAIRKAIAMIDRQA
jgi:hypothetical protein